MTQRSRSSNNDIVADLQRGLKAAHNSIQQLVDQQKPFLNWRYIGTPGNPFFNLGWSNSGDPNYPDASYWLSNSGIVHLQGRVLGGTGVIFTLPLGYRPGVGRHQFVVNASGGFGVVEVRSDGSVVLITGISTYVQLDTIIFRSEN